jgi:hypothetical protein
MTDDRLRFIVARMRIGQVVLFLALGVGLIWWGLEIVYERPILAGVLFPIGVLFVFLGVAFVVREIRGGGGGEQGPEATGGDPQQRDE